MLCVWSDHWTNWVTRIMAIMRLWNNLSGIGDMTSCFLLFINICGDFFFFIKHVYANVQFDLNSVKLLNSFVNFREILMKIRDILWVFTKFSKVFVNYRDSRPVKLNRVGMESRWNNRGIFRFSNCKLAFFVWQYKAMQRIRSLFDLRLNCLDRFISCR